MATHDYVIANGTGAAVRSDLNNALAAIVSNNSSSSEPGTTYAYQWWADTNANVLKIRNSANDGWITLRELDGTMLIEDGSASTPGLAFADDVNTGIFSPAADQIGFATGGAERLEIGSSEVVFNDPSNDVDFRVESNGNTHMLFVDAGNDLVGIGTSGPKEVIDARGAAVFSGDHATSQNAYGTAHGIMLSSTSNLASIKAVSNGSNDVAIRFIPLSSGSGSEAMRLDASGNLGLGTTSPTQKLDVRGSVYVGTNIGVNTTSPASKIHIKGGSLTVEHNSPSTGTGQVNINVENDSQATFSYDDEGRIVFGTSTDPATQAGFSEKMRLGSDGKLLIGSSTGSVHADRLLTVGKTDRSATYISITSATDGIGGIVFADTTTNDTGGYRGIVEYQHNNDDMVFRTSAVEHMRLLSEGRLKVTNTGGSGSEYHTNANFSSIHQSGGGNVIAGFENSHASDSYGIVIRFSGGAPDNNSNYYIECNDTSTTRFQVLSDGDVRNHDNSYGSTSDEKLKQDIVDAGSQWDDLKDLRVRKFKFKSDVAAYGDEAKVLIGLVAQEAELVSPGLVTDSPDLDDDGNDLGTVTKSVRYSVLYMKAVKALQEAMSRIETLEAKVAALEAG
jgi:hypothetical protein